MSWPLEMSKLVDEYAGPFRFWDDADRNMIMTRERRVFDHVEELKTSWERLLLENAQQEIEDELSQRRDIRESMDDVESDDDDLYMPPLDCVRVLRGHEIIKPDSLIGEDDPVIGSRILRTEAEWVEIREREHRACDVRRAAYYSANAEELARQFAALNW